MATQRARGPMLTHPVARRNGGLAKRIDGSAADRLLGASAALFRRTGYAAATTRELASDLGIRSASLYYHIGKKEDLLYSICVNSLERIITAVRASLDSETDPVRRIRSLVATHINVALADRDEHATMLFELRSLSPRRRAKVVGLRDRYERLVREALADGQAAGVIRSDIAAKNLTLTLLNLLNWTIFWFQPKGGLTPQQIAEMYSDVFLEGARAPKGPSRPQRRSKDRAAGGR